eukprot:gene24124-30434_t
MSRLGTTITRNTVHRLRELVDVSGESDITPSGKFLLLGHGSGGEILQVFAAHYPSSVAGLGLLDAYPSSFRMLQYSAKRIKTDSVTQVMESVSFARPVIDVYLAHSAARDSSFSPSSEFQKFKSTFNNGLYWASLYNDFCLHPHGFVLNTDNLGHMSASTESNSGGNIHWPQLNSGVPVLIVVASESVQKKHDAALYLQQSLDYNATLSPTQTSQWVLCDDCHHSFPITKQSVWLAGVINDYFEKYV